MQQNEDTLTTQQKDLICKYVSCYITKKRNMADAIERATEFSNQFSELIPDWRERLGMLSEDVILQKVYKS